MDPRAWTIGSTYRPRVFLNAAKDGAIKALVVLASPATMLLFSIDDALEDIQPVFDCDKSL